MGRFLKKRSGDFFKSQIFFNLGGVPNQSQEKVEMRYFMTNLHPKKAPCYLRDFGGLVCNFFTINSVHWPNER